MLELLHRGLKPVHLDCEFLRNDLTPSGLVSMGLYTEGREYYAVNADMNYPELKRSEWMMENVWPHLPQKMFPSGTGPSLDLDHEDVKPYKKIRDEVSEYFAAVCRHDLNQKPRKSIRMVVYCGGQDTVRLHTLWENDFAQIPSWVPLHADDMASIILDSGVKEKDLPAQDEETLHHALYDARHQYRQHQYVLFWESHRP